MLIDKTIVVAGICWACGCGQRRRPQILIQDVGKSAAHGRAPCSTENGMKVDFIIDGATVGAADGATYKRLDPVTGKVATEAAAASPADVDKAVEAAARAFPAWSATGPNAAPRAAQQGGRPARKPRRRILSR